jgi:hypothetical protein
MPEQPHTARACTRLAAIGLSLVAVGFTTPSLRAQQPAGATALVGVVVDQTSGVPIRGALVSLGDRGPRAISDSIGIFRMSSATPGPATVSVRAFGYRDLEVATTIGPSSAFLRLSLSPDPVALQGLEVTGSASVLVSGVVRNARTGTPVPWASVVLSQDAVRPLGRASSDPQGVFSIGEVPTGGYFLRLQAIGYVSRYHVVSVSAPPETMELEMEPDSVILRGVTRFTGYLRGRRNYAAGINFGYGQDRLHYTAAPSVTQFLELETSLFLVECSAEAQAIGTLCIVARGGAVVEPSVYIDEIPIMAGLEVLRSYSPSELYLVEVFGGGRSIRAYTYPFMERMARKPMALLPP